MTNLLDYILDLFRDPVRADEFVKNPDRAMANAGLQTVTAAQVQTDAATAAPSLAMGGGNPIHGLQQAVAESTASRSSRRRPSPKLCTTTPTCSATTTLGS